MKTKTAFILFALALAPLASFADESGLGLAQSALRSVISGKSSAPVPKFEAVPVAWRGGSASTPAPAFSLKGIDGKTVSLSDYKGQYVLLDFFATWCKYCKKAIPAVIEAQAKYGPKGLNIVIINKGESLATMKRYAANPWDDRGRPIRNNKGTAAKIKSPFLADSNQRISNKYLAFSIPTFVLIGPDGSIIDRGTGAGAKDRLIRKWKQLEGIQ
jgi:thiol-disulfide isomerase/thioredoxin